MNSRNKTDLKLLISSSAALTLGSSIIWTGLPVYVSKITDNYTHTGMLFIAQTIGSLLLTLIGGYFADRFSKKYISISCFLMNAILLFYLWYIISPGNIELIYTIAIFESCINALGLISLGTWFNGIADKLNDLESNIGKKGFISSGAKLIGMSLGPTLFLIFEEKAIIYNAIAYLLAVIILIFVRNPSILFSKNNKNLIREVGEGFVQIITQKKFHNLLVISIITGIFTFPLINISLYTLKTEFSSSDYLISVFWFVGSAGSLIGNLMLAKRIFIYISKRNLFILSNLIMAVGLFSMSVSSTPLSFIAFFALYTVTNPIINNLVISELYRRMDKAYQGRITAAEFTITDLVTISVLFLFNFYAETLPMPLIILVGLPLVFIRTLIGIKTFTQQKDKKLDVTF